MAARFTAQEVCAWRLAGRPVVDVRSPHDFLRGFVKDSRLLPFRRGLMAPQVADWWPDGGEVVLIAPSDPVARSAEIEMAAVGVRVVGQFVGDAHELAQAGVRVLTVPEIGVGELHRRLAVTPPELKVLDVREAHEWAAGHLPGATWIPLGEVDRRLPSLDPEAAWAVICASGVRSARAAAFMADRGISVVNVRGGMNEWVREGLPVLRG